MIGWTSSFRDPPAARQEDRRWIFDTLLARGVLAMIYNPEVRINPPLVIDEDQAMAPSPP